MKEVMRMIKGKEGELQAQIHKRVINKRAILQVREKKNDGVRETLN